MEKLSKSLTVVAFDDDAVIIIVVVTVDVVIFIAVDVLVVVLDDIVVVVIGVVIVVAFLQTGRNYKLHDSGRKNHCSISRKITIITKAN